MKQFLNNRLIISLLCLTLFSTNVKAEVERPYVYTLSLSYHNKLSWGEVDNGNKSTKDGYRCPSRPVSIVITQTDGVQIPHVDKMTFSHTPYMMRKKRVLPHLPMKPISSILSFQQPAR